jgi:hypothetical protein
LIERTQPTGAKLLYVTTTPFMKDRFYGNMVVEQLNAIAVPIMQQRGIPVADLYSHVTSFCGAVYNTCSLCDDELDNVTNIYCGYLIARQDGIILAPSSRRSIQSCLGSEGPWQGQVRWGGAIALAEGLSGEGWAP